MTMKRRWSWALAVMAGVMALAFPADAKPSMPRDEVSPRLTRKGTFGKIAVFSGRKSLPSDAEVSVERRHVDDVKRKIHQGWSKRKRSGKNAASPKDSPARGSDTPVASDDGSSRGSDTPVASREGTRSTEAARVPLPRGPGLGGGAGRGVDG